MSDGLEWLICDEPCKVMDARSGCHCAKARDEIARLRERLEIDPSHPYDGIYCRDETIRLQDAEIANLRATHSNLIGTNRMLKAQVAERDTEIAKLRAEVERARVREQKLADEANRLLDEVKASDKKVFYLTAEVERLREALEEIVKPGGADDFWQCYDIARAALNPSQEPRT